jgi:tetratricopeptide (TPR) repeat protein
MVELVVRKAKQDESEALGKAVLWFQNALTLKSDYVPAEYYLAVVLDREGKTAEAITYLEKVSQQDQVADHLFELGVLYTRVGDRAKAIQAFERAVAMDGAQMRARWQLASLYEDAGRLDDALVQLRTVAASVPTNTAVQKRLQVLEAKTKKK